MRYRRAPVAYKCSAQYTTPLTACRLQPTQMHWASEVPPRELTRSASSDSLLLNDSHPSIAGTLTAICVRYLSHSSTRQSWPQPEQRYSFTQLPTASCASDARKADGCWSTQTAGGSAAHEHMKHLTSTPTGARLRKVGRSALLHARPVGRAVREHVSLPTPLRIGICRRRPWPLRNVAALTQPAPLFLSPPLA